MFPHLVSAGRFSLPAYGVLVALGFLAGLWLAVRLARRSGLNADLVTNAAAYAAIAGLVGAKLLMFVVNFGYYREHPEQILSLATLLSAGVFFGGLILAIAVALWYMRAKGLPRWQTADAFAPGLALGHGIGRIGCFAAGCCWGLKCDRAWAVTFTNPEAERLVGVPLGVPLHPTQLYEAAAEAVIFPVIYAFYHRPHKPGAVLGLYLALYSAARFALEFFRDHQQPNPWGGPLSSMQWLSLALLASGVYLIGRRAA